MQPRKLMVIAAVAVTALAGTACKQDGNGEATTTTAEPATTAPPTSASRSTSQLLTDVNAVLAYDPRFEHGPEQRQVAEAYVRAEQASLIAGLAPPDPNHPDLLATFTGRQLAKWQQGFSDLAAKGQAFSEPTIVKIIVGEVKQLSPTRYRVDSCDVIDTHPYEVATNQLLEQAGPNGAHLLTELELVDSVWKIELQGRVSLSEGVMGCADGPSAP